jgi:GrpB-like predicted nucleotidyltransferase (UPF0157 family)
MLTKGQKDYLSKLNPKRANSPVIINKYNLQTEKVTKKVIDIIIKKIPKADVRFMGSSALKICGQNDVDIYIICPPNLKNNYLSKLKPIFGNQIKNKNKWKWIENGIEVSVYLSDPNDKKFQEQLEIFNIFKNNSQILKKYEELKKTLNGKSYKEYQIAKYEFYNRILNIENK